MAVESAPSIVAPDFAWQQARYRVPRHFIRDFLLRTLAFNILARVQAEGLPHVPEQGPAILIYNHTHAIDAVVVAGVVRPRFIVPMSKIENSSLPIFGQLMRMWGAFPVRRGQIDRTALQLSIELIQAGHLVLIAPEGTRQPALIRGKDGVAFIATRSSATVIPVAIDGTTAFTGNLKRLRRTPITVRFGQPFRFRQRVVARDALGPLTDAAMYQLAALLPQQRRGYYPDVPQASSELIELL
jgi:1-acyl-sn-glycerol-3-phosphate acyltransferase